MKHYVYKIIHIDTGEFYYGSRSCNCNINDDDYMGSMVRWNPNKSKLIKIVIKDSFKNRQDAFDYENKIIKSNIKNPLNRNYHSNNTFHFYGGVHTEETKKRISSTIKKNTQRGDNHYTRSRGLTEEHRKNIGLSQIGTTHSDETKSKMSESALKIDRSEYNLARKKIEYIPTGKIYDSMYQASKELGTSRNRIRGHINNNVDNPQFREITNE